MQKKYSDIEQIIQQYGVAGQDSISCTDRFSISP